MSNRGEIENLLYEYQARLDAGDLEAMAALFEHAVMSADTIDQTWHGVEARLVLVQEVLDLHPGRSSIRASSSGKSPRR